MLKTMIDVLLDADPKNYIAYFRRAAVYLGMGKSKSALPDLSKVIELKSDFTAVSVRGSNPFTCNSTVIILGSITTRQSLVKTR